MRFNEPVGERMDFILGGSFPFPYDFTDCINRPACRQQRASQGPPGPADAQGIVQRMKNGVVCPQSKFRSTRIGRETCIASSWQRHREVRQRSTCPQCVTKVWETRTKRSALGLLGHQPTKDCTRHGFKGHFPVLASNKVQPISGKRESYRVTHLRQHLRWRAQDEFLIADAGAQERLVADWFGELGHGCELRAARIAR